MLRYKTNTLFVLLTFLFLFGLFGCSESKENTPSHTIINTACHKFGEDLLSCDFKNAVCSGKKRQFKDKTGDVKKDFIDLSTMQYTIGNDCIGVTLTMKNLPEELTFNHNALADNANNYSWSALFDMDSSGNLSDGDIVVDIDKYTFESSKELTGKILKHTQKTIGVIEQGDDAFVSHTIVKAFISATISDNSFNLYLPKALYPGLEEITESTNIIFSTQFNDGNNRYNDSYP